MNGANGNNLPQYPQHNQPPYPGQWVPAVRPESAPEPLPPRPASIIRPAVARAAGAVRRVKPSAWVEIALALPWLWWSWLAISLAAGPSDNLRGVLTTVWIVSAAAIVLYPPLERQLAKKVYRLRKPFEWELRRLGPAWWAVCTAAGVDPNRYRLWIHEGPEATPPYPAPGAAIAVTNWAL